MVSEISWGPAASTDKAFVGYYSYPILRLGAAVPPGALLPADVAAELGRQLFAAFQQGRGEIAKLWAEAAASKSAFDTDVAMSNVTWVIGHGEDEPEIIPMPDAVVVCLNEFELVIGVFLFRVRLVASVCIANKEDDERDTKLWCRARVIDSPEGQRGSNLCGNQIDECFRRMDAGCAAVVDRMVTIYNDTPGRVPSADDSFRMAIRAVNTPDTGFGAVVEELASGYLAGLKEVLADPDKAVHVDEFVRRTKQAAEALSVDDYRYVLHTTGQYSSLYCVMTQPDRIDYSGLAFSHFSSDRRDLPARVSTHDLSMEIGALY